MENFEKVEKLREKANVSFEEAKQALENSNWDILEAMISLEKAGKVGTDSQAHYSTKDAAANTNYNNQNQRQYEGQDHFADSCKQFGHSVKNLIEKGNVNSFCATKAGKEIFRLPVTLLVVLLLFMFWCVVPLLVIGLFLDVRYHFEGPNVAPVNVDLNKAMDGAADTVVNIKKEFDLKENKDEL